MKLITLNTSNAETFLAQLKNNFPINERREDVDEIALFSNPNFFPYYIENNGEIVGLFALWQLSSVVFVEHFAIFDKFKNKGLGTKALEVLKNSYGNIVLEVEPPETETAKRRIAFYKRNGFSVCNNLYYQPPYRPGDSLTRLNLLYFSNSFEFERVKQELYSKVYNYTEN